MEKIIFKSHEAKKLKIFLEKENIKEIILKEIILKEKESFIEEKILESWNGEIKVSIKLLNYLHLREDINKRIYICYFSKKEKYNIEIDVENTLEWIYLKSCLFSFKKDSFLFFKFEKLSKENKEKIFKKLGKELEKNPEDKEIKNLIKRKEVYTNSFKETSELEKYINEGIIDMDIYLKLYLDIIDKEKIKKKEDIREIIKELAINSKKLEIYLKDIEVFSSSNLRKVLWYYLKILLSLDNAKGKKRSVNRIKLENSSSNESRYLKADIYITWKKINEYLEKLRLCSLESKRIKLMFSEHEKFIKNIEDEISEVKREKIEFIVSLIQNKGRVPIFFNNEITKVKLSSNLEEEKDLVDEELYFIKTLDSEEKRIGAYSKELSILSENRYFFLSEMQGHKFFSIKKDEVDVIKRVEALILERKTREMTEEEKKESEKIRRMYSL